MRLPSPLHPGLLLRRYKRFLVDVAVEGERLVVAHCADPGRLPGLALPGARVWLSESHKPQRRLTFTLELIEQGQSLVAVNSRNPNRLAREGLEQGRFAFARDFDDWSPEPRLSDGSRLDFLLRNAAGARLWLEVKGVSWNRDGVAAFPDAPTERGRRHLDTLAALARAGERAVLLLIAQRRDVEAFAPAADVDPAWAEALSRARAAGVHVEAWRCVVNHQLIHLDREIPLV
jgi:sugar fermentation stimulation protein A